MNTTEEGASAPPSPSSLARPGNRLRGILFLCAGLLVFSLQDVIIKWISGIYPVSQILAIRSLVGFAPLLVLMHFDGGLARIRTRRLPLQLLRAGLLFFSYTSYYLAIASIPLAEAVSLYYSAPLFIVALSGPILHERIGLARWLSVAFGLIGVVVICRPGAQLLDPAALLSVASAAFYGAAQVLARRLGTTERTSTMALYQNATNFTAALLLAAVAGGGAYAESDHPALQFLLRAWLLPDAGDLLLIASTGLIAAFGSWFLTHAYRIAEASIVAPFEYSAIVWAVLWGYFVWGEVPNLFTVAGVILVVAAGLYLLRSARRPG